MSKRRTRRTPAPRRLYHFTCAHGFQGITKTGVIEAHVHPVMPALGPLVWLTEQPAPSAQSVGFGGVFSICDHMAYRYVVMTKAAVPWREIRSRAPHAIVAALEKYGAPESWWVLRRSALPSEFVLDQIDRVDGVDGERAKRYGA